MQLIQESKILEDKIDDAPDLQHRPLSLIPEQLEHQSLDLSQLLQGDGPDGSPRRKYRSKSFPRTRSQIQAMSSNKLSLDLAGSTEATQVVSGDAPPAGSSHPGPPPSTAPAGISSSRRSSKSQPGSAPLSGSLSNQQSTPSASRRNSKGLYAAAAGAANHQSSDAASHSSGSRRPSYLSTNFNFLVLE